MSLSAPSSGASRHLLPQGEKGTPVVEDALRPPSPLVGEGARRADEGGHDLLLVRARKMRHEPTEAERAIWLILRNRRFSGHKFRRQVPLGPFIADFVCYAAKLIIEADGSQHGNSEYDTRRDADLKRRGFRVLRFWNNDIMARPESVADAIWAALEENQ